ncbi:MAG: M16 family metallopeptidase, partial [Candidatus Xenobia bacterium]
DAEQKCDQAFIKLLWGERWTEVEPLGSRQSVRGLTAAALYPFYESRFRCVHTHLVLAGPPGLVVPELSLPDGPPASDPPRDPVPSSRELKLRTIYEDAPESYLLMAFPISISDPVEEVAGDLISTLLTGCEFIGLYKSIIDEAVLAYDIQSGWTVHRGHAYLSLSGWIPHRNLPRVLDMIFAELRRMAVDGVRDEAFEIGLAQERISLLSSLEGPRRLLGLYDDLHVAGFSVRQALDALDRVTPRDVQRLARRLFLETPPIVVVHGPGKRREVERWLVQSP